MEKLHVKEKAITKKVTKNILNNIMMMTNREEIKHEYERLWAYARYGDGK